jgi:hypothetical protein
MPECGTQPSNHYLPRRKTTIKVRDDQLYRADNPLKIDGSAFDADNAHLTNEDSAT